MSRPASIVLFERLWIAALILGAVNMAIAWPMTLAIYRDAGLFAALGIEARLGFLLIDAVSLILQTLLLLFVSRAGSRVAGRIALLFAAWALIVIARMLSERGAVPGAQGMLATICIILQVAGALVLLRPDAQAWLKGRRS